MNKKLFGQFIKDARLKQNLTQADLAEKLFIDTTAVSKWERGINFPDISMIADICKCLDITEHELIESSKDTEYRQMMYNSKRYLRNKKITFWSYTGSFILAALTCFIVNLSVTHTLSWFFIVLSSLALGYWMSMYPYFIKKALRHAQGEAKSILTKFTFLIYTVGLLVLTLALLGIINAYSPIDIRFAIQVTTYSYLILIAYGIIELIGANRYLKLGIDSLLTGGYLIGLGYVLPDLMKVERENYFDVNYLDWANHTSANVACLILASFLVTAIILAAIGIKQNKVAKKDFL